MLYTCRPSKLSIIIQADYTISLYIKFNRLRMNRRKQQMREGLVSKLSASMLESRGVGHGLNCFQGYGVKAKFTADDLV